MASLSVAIEPNRIGSNRGREVTCEHNRVRHHIRGDGNPSFLRRVLFFMKSISPAAGGMQDMLYIASNPMMILVLPSPSFIVPSPHDDRYGLAMEYLRLVPSGLRPREYGPVRERRPRLPSKRGSGRIALLVSTCRLLTRRWCVHTFTLVFALLN